MLRDVRRGHRTKGARPYVQGDACDLVACGLKPGQQIIGEMQACRGSRHGARLTRVDRLVANLVVGRANRGPPLFSRRLDVRGQWNRADLVNTRQQPLLAWSRKAKLDLPARTTPEDFGVQVACEPQARAERLPAQPARQCVPVFAPARTAAAVISGHPLDQEDLNPAARGLAA